MGWTTYCFGFAVISALVLAGCSHSPSAGPPPAPTSSSTGASDNLDAAPAAAVKPPFERPLLQEQRGQYFSYSMPAGWKAMETTNGVDMISPDGKLIANSVLLMGSPGASDPWTFLTTMLTAIGMRDLKGITTTDQPSQPSGYPGVPFVIKTFEITFSDPKLGPRHAECTVGVCSAYGGNSAAMQGFSTPPEKFEEFRTWMPLLCEGVKAIPGANIAQQNSVILAQNHPLHNEGLMKSWELRRASQDRINQKQHETTMGYERMVSPINGAHYNMPFENYDGTMGGYRDPANRNEILKHAPPGE